jgi:hypothetical protein
MRKIVEAPSPEGRFVTEAARVEIAAIQTPYVPHPHPDWHAIPDGVLCVVDVFCREVWMRGKGRQWLWLADEDARIACEP